LDHDIVINTLHREIELMVIYHRLYKPFPDKWEDARDLERALWKTGNTVSSGAQPKSEFTSTVRTALYDALEFNEIGMLIGHWGCHELQGGAAPVNEKIQILTLLEPELVVEKVEAILRDITPVKLEWKTEELYIPEDLHLRRTTYYHEWQSQRIPLFDTFNSLHYEIVPHVTGQVKKIQVGNPYVLQRFLLIDLWTINILAAGNYVTKDYAIQKRSAIIARVSSLRDDEYVKLCGGDDYIGVYKDLAIERRRVLKQEEKFRPYKPLEYFEGFGKLRELGPTGGNSI